MPPTSSRVVVVVVVVEEGAAAADAAAAAAASVPASAVAEEGEEEEDESNEEGIRSRHGSAVWIISSVEAAVFVSTRIVLFVSVPFFYRFHDKTDYHRFTFTELDRMLRIFQEYRLFPPDCYGYGGVLLDVATFYQIRKFPFVSRLLAKCVNAMLAILLTLVYAANRNAQSNSGTIPLKEYKFYHTHLSINSSFCGWARK